MTKEKSGGESKTRMLGMRKRKLITVMFRFVCLMLGLICDINVRVDKKKRCTPTLILKVVCLMLGFNLD